MAQDVARVLDEVYGRGAGAGACGAALGARAAAGPPLALPRAAGDDEQLQKDMLLLDMIRMEIGMSPQHNRNGAARVWGCHGGDSGCARAHSRCLATARGRGPRSPHARTPRSPHAPRTPRTARAPALSPALSPAPPAPASPGQLRTPPAPAADARMRLPALGAASPAADDAARLSSSPMYWPSVSSMSDNDEDTLFDMLLNSLTLEAAAPGGECGDDATLPRPATPPVQPWSPPSHQPNPRRQDAPELE